MLNDEGLLNDPSFSNVDNGGEWDVQGVNVLRDVIRQRIIDESLYYQR